MGHHVHNIRSTHKGTAGPVCFCRLRESPDADVDGHFLLTISRQFKITNSFILYKITTCANLEVQPGNCNKGLNSVILKPNIFLRVKIYDIFTILTTKYYFILVI